MNYAALLAALALAVPPSQPAAQNRSETVRSTASRIASERKAAVEQDAKEVQSTVLRGDLAASRVAIERAVEGKPQAERVQVQIAAADALARLDDPDSAREAARLYAVSLDTEQLVDTGQRLRTRNNYASVLLRTDRAAEARAQLDAIGAAMRNQPAAARARYLYNYGQAIEATGDPRIALQIYQQALTADPNFEEPGRAASRLALDAPSETIGIPATVSLVDTMIAKGQFAAAGEHLRQACVVPRWISHPDYARLLASVAGYLAAANVHAAEFRQTWLDPLSAAATGARSPRVRRRYDDLRRAYEPDGIPLVFWPPEARARFAHWLTSDGEAAAYVSLLQETGRQMRVATQPVRALERLGSAWALSSQAGPVAADAGMAAAVDLADLLLTSGGELNSGPILDQLISQLFEGKGAAYEGHDYANALRFHLLLGSIFEQQGRWGPASDPRTALFQWEMAIRNHAALLERGRPGDLEEVPGLHLRLALAWEQVKDPAAAFRELLAAADGFLALGRMDQARAALARARTLLPAADAGADARLRALEERVPPQR